MKKIFVPIYSNLNSLPKNFSSMFNTLPKEIALFYSVQFKSLAQNFYSSLSENKKITLFSQVLGCSRPKIPKETKAILLVGEGRFHAISLAYESNLPVYIYEKENIVKISQEEINKISSLQKSALLNYLSCDKFGIIISTKPGQSYFKQALDFKNSLKEKKGYLFVSNEINTSEFENFSLKSYVNTACPRMDFVSPKLINLSKLKEIND